jgi:hypothetical protein
MTRRPAWTSGRKRPPGPHASQPPPAAWPSSKIFTLAGRTQITGGGQLLLGGGDGIAALLGGASLRASNLVTLSAAEKPQAALADIGSVNEDTATHATGSAVGGAAVPVPEPSTLVLLAAGVLMLAAARRCRRD